MGALLDATELTAVRLCGAGGIPTPTACVQEKKYCLYTLRRTAQGLYTQPGKSQGEEGTAQPGAGERAQHWHTDTGRQNTLLQAEQLLLKLKATNTHTHRVLRSTARGTLLQAHKQALSSHTASTTKKINRSPGIDVEVKKNKKENTKGQQILPGFKKENPSHPRRSFQPEEARLPLK